MSGGGGERGRDGTNIISMYTYTAVQLVRIAEDAGDDLHGKPHALSAALAGWELVGDQVDITRHVLGPGLWDSAWTMGY